MRDGHRIPLLRLRQLCNDAEVEGSRIAIIGDVETRIAFYVGSDGEVVNGAWEVDAIPAWHGVRRGVVQIGDTRATILEAADLLDRYQALVSNPPDTSAAYGEPREGASGENTGNDKRETDTQQRHVLVIERSEGLQQEFSSILSSSPLRAKIVGDIDSAIESLSKELPTLIISEFRVPSMAAKMLVERLKADGVDIPVIVTTAHDGNNAETLVQKLGVAGYISKPLKASEVMKRIDGALTGRVGRR
jgi:CheY-like chemotaxis protein